MTNQTKHTPGPWLIADESKTFVYALGKEGTNVFSCNVESAGTERASKREKEANARLIASAPELLEALKSVIEEIDMSDSNGYVDCLIHQDEYKKITNIIAKAEGRA